ncbi:hypothetical protein [Parendozoicomonas sp. Alg238-R29]|uniref:hypothetical protein n=1 Tax=Parendozoicomonas sp. Alg238-R29 TaxID=2993446 RepID=UPI00248F1C44|nr:hypothetical protein [Parendozoicomonas sp. Alg238-R29]
MASASRNYDSALRPSTMVQQTPPPPTKRKRPARITRVQKAPVSDIHLISSKSGPDKHTYLSLRADSVEVVQPNTYVARLMRNAELPDHDLVVDESNIAGRGVFTPEGTTFLEKETLSSYSRGAKFAFRLKHQDWAGDHRMSCFLAFVIDDNNEVQPVSQYEYILWTHVRVKWKSRTDIQLGILPADRSIRMINHQKSEANAEIVTLVNPDVYCYMEQEGSEETSLVPVVDAQKLMKTSDPNTPLPVQVIFQARQEIGPDSRELFFDYFEGDENQEEFDPSYELVWIFWNESMKKKVKKLTDLKISDVYAPVYCEAAPTLPPEEEAVSLHNTLQVSYEKACEGGKENLEAFILSFAKHWRYHHPGTPLLLAEEFEKQDTWSTKEFCFIRDFYRALLTMLDGTVPALGQADKKWSIPTLGSYLLESNLFDLATSNRLIHPDWLWHLSRSQPEKYAIYLKRSIRQQLADGKHTNPLAKLLRSTGLRTCDTQEELTHENLSGFINRNNLESSEDINDLVHQMGTNRIASDKIRRLISNGSTEAAKALVKEFITVRHYSLQKIINGGPLKTLSITGKPEEKYTTIPQLVQFINTHMPEEATSLINDPLLISTPNVEDVQDDSASHDRLLEIWRAVTEATGDAGEKTRNECLHEKIGDDNPESRMWLECHIRHCFIRVKERDTARFSSSVISSLECMCPLSTINSHLREDIPELEDAVNQNKENWDKPLLLAVCAGLGINNLILQNGQMLATHIAAEMELTADIKMRDTHAALLHPQKAICVSEALPNGGSRSVLGIGELVEQDITYKYDDYSQKIRSKLASLWYTYPLDKMITHQVMSCTSKAAGFLNDKKIYPPYGGDKWTAREIAEYLLRHGLTTYRINRTKPEDKRHFSVYIAENLPFCWQPPSTENCAKDGLDLAIPKGLEESVRNLRQDVNDEIQKSPKFYTNRTLISLARAGFVSASNEMIKRFLPKRHSDNLTTIRNLQKYKIHVYSQNQWYWPTYRNTLSVMKEHKFVSERTITMFEKMLTRKNLLNGNDQEATSSASVQPDRTSDTEDNNNDAPETQEPPLKKQRLSPQPE